jgi:hypothetical protein
MRRKSKVKPQKAKVKSALTAARQRQATFAFWLLTFAF